jgi:predicted  nucleic acid-binding Zn-ribbon protein
MIELINMSDAHIQNVRREITRLQAEDQKIRDEITRLQKYVEEAAETVEKYRSELNTQTSGGQPAADSTFTLS